MTIFVTWKITNDTEARQVFEAITRIQVQMHPLKNKQETHFMVGVQVSPPKKEALASEDVFEVSENSPPEWWEPLEIPIEDV